MYMYINHIYIYMPHRVMNYYNEYHKFIMSHFNSLSSKNFNAYITYIIIIIGGYVYSA